MQSDRLIKEKSLRERQADKSEIVKVFLLLLCYNVLLCPAIKQSFIWTAFTVTMTHWPLDLKAVEFNMAKV